MRIFWVLQRAAAEGMLPTMNQTDTPREFDPNPPETLDSFQTNSNVWSAERGQVSFDAVRRGVHFLGQVIEDETSKGKRVEVELLGTFSRASDGEPHFEHQLNRDWLSMDTYIESDLADRLACDPQ